MALVNKTYLKWLVAIVSVVILLNMISFNPVRVQADTDFERDTFGNTIQVSYSKNNYGGRVKYACTGATLSIGAGIGASFGIQFAYFGVYKTYVWVSYYVNGIEKEQVISKTYSTLPGYASGYVSIPAGATDLVVYCQASFKIKPTPISFLSYLLSRIYPPQTFSATCFYY